MRKLFLILSIINFSIFVYFSRLVEKGYFKQFDFDTTVKLQNHFSHAVDFPFSLFSILGTAEITTIIWLILAGIILFKRMWKVFVAMFLFFSSVIVEIFGKLVIYHPAPPHFFYRGVIQFNLPSSYVSTDYSYPSGHVTRTMFLITFLISWLVFRRNGTKKIIGVFSLAALAVIMMVSRVYLGEHWTSDVIGGLFLGTSLGLIAGLTISSKPLPKSNPSLDKP